MKRFVIICASALLICCGISAQTTETYLPRYNALVSRVGFSGIGVETLLDRWEKADPEDINHMVGRFNFYLSRSMRDSVVVSAKANYLDMKPLMALKDSLGKNVYYYNEKVFNQEDFAKAVTYIDRAISFDNTRLDLYFLKLDAFVTYEKTVPDTGRDLLIDIVNKNFASKYIWKIPDSAFSEETFLQEIQDYCIGYYNIGSPQSLAALKAVSERVLKFRPKRVDFINNMGAYCVSQLKDDKKAAKYYNSVLKIDPDNVVAKQNLSLIARRAAKAKAGK